MQASSIAIIDAGVIPCMRIIERIIVLHMSAQFMHAGAHDIICVEHTVHACSQAEQASIQACRTDMSIMSMPGIDIMSFDIMSIIIESIVRLASRSVRAVHPPAAHGRRVTRPGEGPRRLDRVMSQGIHKPTRTRLAAALAAAALVAASALLIAPPASAHDELLGTDPAADSTVDTLPESIALTYSNLISTDPGASIVEVTDAAGTALSDGEPTTQDNVLTQPLAGEASGVITVLWKVVSSDGHPISGEFTFTVAAAEPTPTATTEPSPTASESATASETPVATPTPTAAPDEDSTFGDVWPWVIGGILVAGLAGALLYLLVSRPRPGAPGGSPGSTPESDDPSDH
ncbi:hypothetical protein GCM10010460_32770 [Microbacterium terrae]|uniref:Copper resistance protein C n=2 Tax=Microbacterium terrae TaxID=69369 RepID=A0A0M2H9N0_9MICO|nr:Copper resistance protein C precursor [Microbacterium terrae]